MFKKSFFYCLFYLFSLIASALKPLPNTLNADNGLEISSLDSKKPTLNVLNIGNGVEPHSLDWQLASGIQEQRILIAISEGLVNLHPETLAPLPGVAERWEISNDGLTYTFFLKEGLLWSNGDPLTAKDFIFAFERLLNPKSQSPHISFFHAIHNAQSYYTGKITDFKEVGIEIVDNCIIFKLDYPVPYFLSLVSHHSFFPLHEKTLLQYGDKWIRPENIVTNGPFCLKSWVIYDHIRVEKNSFYHNQSDVHLDAIIFFPIEDRVTEYHQFSQGALDITSFVPTDYARALLKANDPRFRTHPYLSTAFYLMNTKRAPLDDVRVRIALNLAIDRSILVNHILTLSQMPAYNLVPPGVFGYPHQSFFHEDIAKAKALLTEAGYPNGKGFPRLTLLYNTSDELQTIAQFVQNQLKENLGIDLVLENQEWATFRQSRLNHAFDLCRGNWVGDYNDPTTFLDLFQSGSSFNTGEWSCSSYDNLLAMAQKTIDPVQRTEYLQQAEDLLMQQMPLVPLYFINWRALVSDKVKGWYNNIMDYHPYIGVSKAQ